MIILYQYRIILHFSIRPLVHAENPERVTPRLDVVAGAVLSRPRATGEGVRLGRVGEHPVGMSRRSMELNLDWRTP